MTAGPLPRHAVDHRNPRPARISGIAGDAASARGQSKAICTRDHGPDRMWPAPHNKMAAGHMQADGSAALSDIASAADAPPRRTLRSGTKWLVTLGPDRRPYQAATCAAPDEAELHSVSALHSGGVCHVRHEAIATLLWIFLVVSWLAGGDDGVIIVY